MPKASIEGTQMPMNVAASFSSLKYKYSEKTKESNAEVNNNLSVVVNFLNIFFYLGLNRLEKIKLISNFYKYS